MFQKPRTWFVTSAAVLAVVSTLAAAEEMSEDSQQLVGLYRSVSESEWTLDIELREDGILVVWYTSWLAEEPEDAISTRYEGEWSHDGDQITIVYGGLPVKLRYYPNLSLEELGKDGSAPGLRGLSKDRAHNLFAERSFWLAEELDKHFPSE